MAQFHFSNFFSVCITLYRSNDFGCFFLLKCSNALLSRSFSYSAKNCDWNWCHRSVESSMRRMLESFVSFFVRHRTIFSNKVALVFVLFVCVRRVSLCLLVKLAGKMVFFPLWCAHSFYSLSNEIIFHSIHFFVLLCFCFCFYFGRSFRHCLLFSWRYGVFLAQDLYKQSPEG